jgi:Flp pilus assembly protein TadB
VDAAHLGRGELRVIGVLALAWGALAAMPFVARARRHQIVARTQAHAPPRPPRPRPPRPWIVATRVRPLFARPPLATFVRVVRAPSRHKQARRHGDVLARELAVAVDLIGVGVAAGATPYLAVELGARWSPPHLARALDEVVRACALGQSFDDALRELAARTPPVRVLTDALRTSARLGAPVAPALTRLAADVRAELRRRAEARARTVPVRLCFPLVGCILPAFALLTVVPVVLDGLHR